MKIRPVGAELFHRTDGHTRRSQHPLFAILRTRPKMPQIQGALPLPNHLTDIFREFSYKFLAFLTISTENVRYPRPSQLYETFTYSQQFLQGTKGNTDNDVPACTVHGGQALANASPPWRHLLYYFTFFKLIYYTDSIYKMYKGKLQNCSCNQFHYKSTYKQVETNSMTKNRGGNNGSEKWIEKTLRLLIAIPEQYNTWNKSTISRKLLKMDVLTFETCWAVNSEIIKQVTSSWSIFIQLSRWCMVQ